MIPYSGPIVTREAAKAAGLKRFFTDIPCCLGHVAERYTLDGKCRACKRIVQRNCVAKKREHYEEKCRKWNEANAERKRQNDKGYKERVRRSKSPTAKKRVYPQNKTRTPEGRKAEYLRNADRIKEKMRERYAAAPELFKAKARARYVEKPESFKQHARNRRARLLKSIGKHTTADIKWLYEAQGHKCAICFTRLRKFEIDHIIPLSRNGRNDRPNLQLLCAPCNRRKHATDPIIYAQRIGRLL